jgi:flagellar biosynthetic protein FliS
VSGDAKQAYLESRVLSATPQKLRLLSIDAAIILLNRTKMCWAEENWDAAYQAASKARALVTDILSSMKFQTEPLAKQIAAIYASIIITITESQLSNDAEKLTQAIRILEEEQKTWREYCELFPEAPEIPAEEENEITSDAPAISPPGVMPGLDLTSDASVGHSMPLARPGSNHPSTASTPSSGGISFDA